MDMIEKLTNELDVEMNRVWAEYTELHKQFNAFCAEKKDEKFIGDNIDELNRMLHEIQFKFSLLYPVYNFIATRHQYVSNAVNSYNEFIENIKKAGAKQEDQKGSIITDNSGIMPNVQG